MLKIFIIAFLIYQPIFLSNLLYLRTKITGYEIKRDVVSRLGTIERPFGFIFNISMVLYGLLGFSLPIYLFFKENNSADIIFGITATIIFSIGAILVGLFPMNTHKKGHTIASYVVFGGIFLEAVTFIPIIYSHLQIRGLLMTFSVISAVLVAILAALNIKTKRNHSRTEWLSVIAEIAWNFLVCLAILIR